MRYHLILLFTLSSIFSSDSYSFGRAVVPYSRLSCKRSEDVGLGIEDVSHKDIDKKKINKKKGQLPTKICEQCNRPMEWRKSWEKNWEEVKFCSDKCRRLKKTKTSIASFLLISSLNLGYLQPSYSYTGPTSEELKQVFDPSITQWDGTETESDAFSASYFRRLDEVT